MERKLNLNIPDRISAFERIMKEFLVSRIFYKRMFQGKGLEFDTFRDYSPYDDALDIDWRASKRANKLLVRQYIEERDLKILIVVDVSDNMVFGSTPQVKCEYATEVAAVLSHLVITSKDQLGYCLFNNGVVDFIPPSGVNSRFYSFVDKLANPEIYRGYSNFNNLVEFLLNTLDSSITAVIIISDFIRMNEELKKNLTFFAERFETVAISINDPLDITLPEIDEEILVEDPVSRQQIVIDPKIAKVAYEQNAAVHEKIIENVFEQAGVDYLRLMTNEDFLWPLAEFMKERSERRETIPG